MFTSTGPNGRHIRLASGPYAATVATVGAALQELTVEGRHLVVPSAPDEIPPAYSGKTLIPWPNRITGGRYTFAGREYELPVNEAATGSAIHGLVLWDDWQVLSTSDAKAVLGHQLMGQPGYPFQLALTVTYELDAGTGLAVTMEATNTGTVPAPYGASSHPYLTANLTPVDRCRLAIPADRVIRNPAEGATETANTAFDYRQPTEIGSARLDHAYTGLPAGPWEVVLSDPDTGFGAVLTADGRDGQARWLQIYSGELLGRRGVAVEPMTCPPDAFNSGQDLVILHPGDNHRLAYRIAARQDS